MAIEIVPAGRADLPDIERFIAGETVGFLGASSSLRPIDGAWEKFCAIAPWYVREAYRSHSLPIFFLSCWPTRA